MTIKLDNFTGTTEKSRKFQERKKGQKILHVHKSV